MRDDRQIEEVGQLRILTVDDDRDLIIRTQADVECLHHLFRLSVAEIVEIRHVGRATAAQYQCKQPHNNQMIFSHILNGSFFQSFRNHFSGTKVLI